MRLVVCFLAALSSPIVLAQTAPLHIEVRSDTGPVAGAAVVVNGTTHKADTQGVWIVTLSSGHVDIVVVKEGFAHRQRPSTSNRISSSRSSSN